MLNPDVNVTQGQIRTAYDSTVEVTNYAQAAISAVPQIASSEAWLQPIKEHIAMVQQHAGSWLKTICPTITKTIPQAVVDFSGSFHTSASCILNLLEMIDQQPDEAPDSEQRKQVDQQFASLLQLLQQQINDMKGLQNDISDFYQKLVFYHTTISDDLSNAQAQFADGSKWVQTLKSDISENFLNSQILGPCNTIVEIDFNISFKAQQSGANPTIITLVFMEAILQNQLANQTKVTPAIQNVLDLWTTLEGKLNAVITDLNRAQGDAYTSVLKQIDLAVAEDQWNQVAEYAKELYGSTLTNTRVISI